MKKLIHLEAARGIASFIVLIHHFALGFAGWIKYHGTGPLTGFSPLNLLSDGSLAVGFFFVLSGFVLPLGLYRRPSLAALSVAVVKRIPRLWLPVAISILAGYFILTSMGGVWQRAGEISGSRWLQNFGFAGLPENLIPTLSDALRQSIAVFLHPKDSYYNSNLWTMFPEFTGSLIVYGIVLMVLATRAIGRGSSFIGIHVLVFMVALLVDAKVALFFSTGTLLASLYLSDRADFEIPKPLMMVFLAAFLIAASYRGGLFSHAALIASVAAMILLLKSRKAADLLSGRIGSFLGELSFPLYLVHTLAILGPGSLVYVHLAGIAPPWAATLGAFVTVVSLSLLGATVLVFVDRWWVGRVNGLAATAITRMRELSHRNRRAA